MEVSAKELENRQAVLTAELEDDWLDPFLRSGSRRLANRLAIPGFRKGRAPHGVVVRHLGKEAVIREVIDELGEAAYEEAVEKAGLEPIQLDDLDIAEWEPLTLRMTVSLKPIVELGDYRSTPVALEEIEVDDSDVEDVLRGLQEQYAERVPVGRSATVGDFALVDLEGTQEGRVVLKLEQQEYELGSDADFPVAEFSDRLIGMSVGEEKAFSAALPDDYEDEELGGHEVAFRVHVRSLHEKRLPEMNDDLARMAGGFAALDELSQKIKEDLHSRRVADQKDEVADTVLDSIAEQAQVDYPPLFLNRELESMVRMLVFDLQRQSFTLEGYLSATDRTVEDLLDEFRPAAEIQARKSLVLEKLVEEEGIEVGDSEIEAEVARITEVYGQDTKALMDTILSDEQARVGIRNSLYGRKIVDRLADLAAKPDGNETAATGEHSVAVGEDLSGASQVSS